MTVIFVARSAKLSKWASDVGLGKTVFKVGVADEPIKPVIEAGWAGETDWQLVGKQDVEGVTEEGAIERLARKLKMVDPTYYPKLKGTRGVFKVTAEAVESSMLVARALANEAQLKVTKLKPADFGTFLINNAIK